MRWFNRQGVCLVLSWESGDETPCPQDTCEGSMCQRVLLTCVPLPLQAGHGLGCHQNVTSNFCERDPERQLTSRLACRSTRHSPDSWSTQRDGFHRRSRTYSLQWTGALGGCHNTRWTCSVGQGVRYRRLKSELGVQTLICHPI